LSTRRLKLRVRDLTPSEFQRFVLVPSYDEDSSIRGSGCDRSTTRLSYVRPQAHEFSARVQHLVWRCPVFPQRKRRKLAIGRIH
jgi:hypothetical protein